MTYELWDIESGNLIQTYELETEALALIRSAIDAYGSSYAFGLALLASRDRGHLVTVAAGEGLANRALAILPPAMQSQ